MAQLMAIFEGIDGDSPSIPWGALFVTSILPVTSPVGRNRMNSLSQIRNSSG